MDYLDASFLPGGAKYGDLPGLLSLAAPTRMWMAGETTDSAAIAKAAYAASGNSDSISFASIDSDDAQRAAIEWIIKGN
jgi:hypothetical protein